MTTTLLRAIAGGVRTPARRRLLAVTVILGCATAVLFAATTRLTAAVYVAITEPTQSVMSVTIAFLGVLLAGDVRRGQARPGPTVAAAVVLAAAVGMVGGAVAAGVTLLEPGVRDPWAGAAPAAAGGVLTQVVAQLTGVGLGLLVGNVVLACAGTVVLPMGAHALLGFAPGLRGWLTPYGVVQDLLSYGPAPWLWARLPVVVLLWNVVPVLGGLHRLTRHRPERPAA